MKKLFLLLVAIFCFQMNIFAQAPVRFGVQLSPSFNWLHSSSNNAPGSGKTLIGLQLGLSAEKAIAENYGVTFGLGFHFNAGGEIYYKQKGGAIWSNSGVSDTIPQDGKVKYNLQFLEIPLGFKMRTQEFGAIRYYVEPGICLGIRTGAKGSVDKGTPNQQDVQISKNVVPLNTLWSIGAGVEYAITSQTALKIGINFQNSFVDVTKDDGVTAQMRGLNLRLGVIF